MERFEGMVLDMPAERQPEGTYRFAMNKILSYLDQAVIDESGTLDLGTVDGIAPFIASVHVDYNTTFIIRQNELSILENSQEQVIVKDQALNIQQGYQVKGASFKNHKGERVVIWTDGHNPVRILNLDNHKLNLTGLYSFVDSRDVTKLNFFPEYEIPSFASVDVNDSGGVLKSGTYSFAIAYETHDGYITDFCTVSNPVFITDDSLNQDFKDIDGCEPGTVTSKSITVNLTGVDTRYKRIVVAVIQRTQSEEVASIALKVDKSTAETVSFEYTGQEYLESILPEEITIGRARYKTAKTLTVADNKFMLGGLETSERIDYQRYANKIKVGWVYTDLVSLDGARGSYKDGRVTFMDKTFMPGEVLPLFITLIKKDGSRTEAFHIPGRESKNVTLGGKIFSEKARIADIVSQTSGTVDYLIEDLGIDSDAKYFQTRDTASVGQQFGEGIMGYWENDEKYPEWFPELAGQNVRHHKFPSIAKLIENYGSCVFKNESGTLTGEINYNINTAQFEFNSPQGINVVNNKVVVTQNGKIKLRYAIHLYSEGEYEAECEAVILHKRGDNVQNEIVNSYVRDQNNDPNYPVITQINIPQTGYIEKKIAVREGDYFEMSFQGYQADGYVRFNYSDIEESALEGSIFSRKLGIELSNIEIPKELADEIQGFEIHYGQRDYSNATILATSIAYDSSLVAQGTTYIPLGEKARFYSPDFLANEQYPSLPVSYIQTEAIIHANNSENSLLRMVDYDTGTLNQKYDLPTEALKVRRVSNLMYEPYAPDTMRETALTAKIDSGLSAGGLVLCTLRSYKKNVFPAFWTAKLVNTGRVFKVNGAKIYGTGVIFGGDTYFGEYSIWRSTFVGQDTEGNYQYPSYCYQNNAISWFTYSVVNPGLRYEGQKAFEKYYPKSNVPIDFDLDWAVDHCCLYDNYHRVDILTRKLNTDHSILVFNADNDFGSKFPGRIAMGNTISSEGTGADVRTFLLAEYYEMPIDKGGIVNLEFFNGKLIIHMEDSLFMGIKDASIQSDNATIVLGSGKLFQVEPKEILTSEGGYAGLQEMSASRITKSGYVFVDSKRSKVFIFSDALNEISNSGLKRFFEDNMSAESNVLVGYDDKYSRLILSVKNPENAFTISYSLEFSKWASFHSYKPEGYFTHKNALHMVKDGKLYQCNAGLRGNFFGKKYQSYIDLVMNPETGFVKLFQAFRWKTTVEDLDGAKYEKQTFNKAFIYNDFQSSGIIDLADGLNIRLLDVYWRFNDFRDKLAADKRGSKIITKTGNIIPGNVDDNMDWKLQKRFINTWVILRLITSEEQDNVVYLQYVDALYRKVL